MHSTKTPGRFSRWLSKDVALGGAIAFFSLALITIIWSAVIAQTRFEREDAISTAIRRNESFALAFEQYAIRTIDSADMTTRYVKREYERVGNQLDLITLAKELDLDDRYFVAVSIFGADGYAIATTVNPRPKVAVNVSTRDHFITHRDHDDGNAYIGKPLQSHALGKMIVPVTRRINRPDGSFAGIVVVLITPTYFTAPYRDATAGSGEVISLIGTDGIIRARRFGQVESAAEDFRGNQLFAEQAKRAVGSYVGTGLRDGVRRYISYRSLSEYSLIAVSAASEEWILAPFEKRKLLYYRSAALTTGLVLLFWFLLSFALSRKRQAIHKLTASEARLAATFNQATTGIAHSGLDGSFLRVNQKLCDMLGYSQHELLALKFSDLTHPADVGKASSFSARLLSQPGLATSANWEERYLCKDGMAVWVSLSVSLVQEDHADAKYFIALIQDITSRKQAESQIHFQARLLATVGQAIIATDLQGTIVYWNQSAETLYGWTAADVMGLNIVDVTPARTSQSQVQEIMTSLGRGESWEGEFLLQRRNGGQFMAQVTNSPISDESGQLAGIISISSDITERKLAETRLREGETQIKSISSNIPGMVFQLRHGLSGHFLFTYVSDGAIAVCGVRPETLHASATPFFDLLHDADRASFFDSMSHSEKTLIVWNWDGRLVPLHESLRWVHVRATPRRVSETAVIWDGVIFNITEAKQREAALDQSQEMLRALSAHQMEVKEAERRRIAREIHDELGQILTVLRMDLLMLPKVIGNQDQSLGEMIDRMRDNIDGILRTVRNIASELRPAALDIGLIFGMEWLVDEFQTSLGIPCTFTNSVGNIALDDHHATGIFRILQESLTNVARHARASRIEVSFDIVDDRLCLAVRDDGDGFESESWTSHKSYGLVGMRERAAMLGGAIEIFSARGRGTVLHVSIPLSRHIAEHSDP
ncbi:hypothetical protein BH11PSE11_BH11PSE11_04430 [soil metagenome]